MNQARWPHVAMYVSGGGRMYFINLQFFYSKCTKCFGFDKARMVRKVEASRHPLRAWIVRGFILLYRKTACKA
ncbi:uncharacterized protein EI90DRAFT_2098824 [Cantharellus anzutake]|uniref:uncharacterized protein n=1 Tax=Cantharellus anzutake TaxID=1750568 RepID=UPI001903CBD7|nr:uncharacterized protein EI90DRAFT_2098824 [Cantharellus anzutake]KAF8340684.1 hypothetical protein EI90DRAFT_2098824 [Cantharellus anzutake]